MANYGSLSLRILIHSQMTAGRESGNLIRNRFGGSCNHGGRLEPILDKLESKALPHVDQTESEKWAV